MLTGYTAFCVFIIFVPTRGQALVFSWYQVREQQLLSQLPCLLLRSLDTAENGYHWCSEPKPAARIGRAGIQLWRENPVLTRVSCMMRKHLVACMGRGVPSPSVSFLFHSLSPISKLKFLPHTSPHARSVAVARAGARGRIPCTSAEVYSFRHVHRAALFCLLNCQSLRCSFSLTQQLPSSASPRSLHWRHTHAGGLWSFCYDSKMVSFIGLSGK